MAQLRRALSNLEAGVQGGMDAFDQALAAYADFTWKHLRTEEHELLPLAEAHLQVQDWDEIATAFSHNHHPLAQAQSESLHDLFRAIVNRTPAPFGLGPA